jgi:hypothetical protein
MGGMDSIATGQETDPSDKIEITLDIFENKDILDVYESVNELGPGENRLHMFGSGVSLELSPNIKSIYAWARQMHYLNKSSPQEFLQMEVRDNIFDYTKEKSIMRVLNTKNDKWVESIPNPTKKDKRLKKKGDILEHLTRFIYILYAIIFLIDIFYSIYLIGHYFNSLEGLGGVVGFVTLITFLALLLAEGEEPIFFIVLDIFAVSIESFLIYKSYLISIFPTLSVILFALVMMLSGFWFLAGNSAYSTMVNLSKRLPSEFRSEDITGDEKVRKISKLVFAKEKFLSLLSNADTTIDNTCPSCNGTGRTSYTGTCGKCNGSGNSVRWYGNESEYTRCDTCSGTGSVTKYAKCSLCFYGKIPAEKYEKELKERISNLINTLSSINDDIREKIEKVNHEIDNLNRKISIWNSKVV